MLTKAKQENLPGYKPTALEVAVKDLLESKESKEAAKDMFDKRCLTVIDEMAKAGKRHLLKLNKYWAIKNLQENCLFPSANPSLSGNKKLAQELIQGLYPESNYRVIKIRIVEIK